MRKLLWVGDAVVSSGFARITHHVLDVMRKSWDVTVLGINHRGDPHDYPYPIYATTDRDPFGVRRVAEIVNKTKPDVVVLLNDPWNIPSYLSWTGNVPVVGFLAVDGKNCNGKNLAGLSLSVFWTRFGMREAQLGGYSGPAAVVPLGVDLDVYRPTDRTEARKLIGLPERIWNSFIVGNINRNQPRKRLDLTISYFADWIKSRSIDDAYLYLHVAPTGDLGYDVSQLMKYYGLSSRLILSEPDIGYGITERGLALTYSALDVQVSTSQGEGWGLPTMEGMACGIPQICPDWSGLGEWARDAAMMVPCSEISVTPNFINAIGGIPNRGDLIASLDLLYSSPEIRARHRELGLNLVRRPQYRWSAIGEEFLLAMEEALYPEKATWPI